jgi:hypothetical protein
MKTRRRKYPVLPAAIGYWLVSDRDGPILGSFFRL